MNSNLINYSIKICSILDAQGEYERSDNIFKLASKTFAQVKGYDPANPLTMFTDPENVERSMGVPGSGTLFLKDDLLSTLPNVPERFKKIKMQDFTAWLSTLVPFFDPNNPEELSNFRRNIFPRLRRSDPAFWNDFKALMKAFNEFLAGKGIPADITEDPVINAEIRNYILQNVRMTLDTPFVSVINDELRKELSTN
jgi:hypothetical protein